MRFSETAYGKCFPRQTPKTVVESAVETFKPTEQPVADEEEVIEDTTVEVNEEGNDGNIEDGSGLD